jgi:hypothetical protein
MEPTAGDGNYDTVKQYNLSFSPFRGAGMA